MLSVLILKVNQTHKIYRKCSDLQSKVSLQLKFYGIL